MISCLMVTQERKFNLAKAAIRCFHKQSMKERELIIVHDSSADFSVQLQAYIKQYSEDAISIWFLTQMYARFWNDLADHASA